MFKKVAAILTAAVMTVGVACTAMAAPSPTVSGIVTGVSTATDASGNAVEVTISAIPAEYETVCEEVKNVETLKTLLGSAYEDGMQVVDIKDVTAPEGASFPLTITINVTGVTASSKVAVLHYDTAAGAWEVVSSKAGNGTIEATFNSLSPVAFVIDGETAAQTTGTTSPKTGEVPVGAYAGVVAVVAALGLVVVSMKRKEA